MLFVTAPYCLKSLFPADAGKDWNAAARKTRMPFFTGKTGGPCWDFFERK